MQSQIINRQTVLEAHAFNVQRVNIHLPDGRIRPYDLVVHNPAVTIVPVNEQGEIYFVRQFRVGACEMLLELPAGVLDTGEDPAIGAAREIREEIGLAAGRLEKLGDFFMAAGYCDEFMHVYLARELKPDPLSGDADEFLQVVHYPAAQVYEMVRNGQLKDAKTLAALLLARPYLGF